MKKTFYIILALLLVSGLAATGQIQRGKKPAQSKPKTEQTSKPSSKSNSSKTNKPSGKNTSSRSKGMTQAEKDRIIQKAIDDMVFVEGGTFTMGATEQDGDAYRVEKPAHQVTLSDYYISKYKVTQALWLAVMGSNPSYFKGDLNRPVEQVSWNDCHKFIKTLNKLTGKRFRLPTEAEWEYAARGGNRSRGYKYSGSNDLGDVAWYIDNSGDTTHPVGQKSPNELGLYDMSGDVYEWCQDWYGSYNSESQTNPTGPSSGSSRVARGGCFGYGAQHCRVSYRLGDVPACRDCASGLRLAL